MPSMVSLDGTSYAVKDYSVTQVPIRGFESGIDGGIIATDTALFRTGYHFSVRCTMTNLAALRTTLAKTGTNIVLAFTDLEGTYWNPTGSGGGKTNTGVYLTSGVTPQLVSEKLGFASPNVVWVPIELVVNSKVL